MCVIAGGGGEGERERRSSKNDLIKDDERVDDD